MWRKKKWFFIAVLAVIVLAVGVMGGVAYAQSDSTDGSTGKTLLARVATILGIDQQKLEDAFTQAQNEMRNEELDARLKSLVEQGKLTQEQADQYEQWWQSRPDVSLEIGPGGRMGRGGFGGGFGCFRGSGRSQASPSPSPT
jgi:hypothetical protein